MKNVAIVGATGSIGGQALDVMARHADRFRICSLSAHADEEGLLEAAAKCRHLYGRQPELCLSSRKPSDGSIAFSGKDGLYAMVRDCDADIVLNAAAGADGLWPSLAAVESGKDLALANKESVVMAGRLVFERAAASGSRILPVDSEHSALFNMIERFGRKAVRGVIITASGGAFRDKPLSELAGARLEDALAHPTWSMGAKITVDSATMANKGLEVIEAARLFDLEPKDISVVIHPESRVHSFIRTREGSLYAQLSRPDMRIPILNALTWPDIEDEELADLDPAVDGLSFRPVDKERYPLLSLAYEALRQGEGACIAYNAANEAAVAAFMAGSVDFLRIAGIVAYALTSSWPARVTDLDEVLSLDEQARTLAQSYIAETA